MQADQLCHTSTHVNWVRTTEYPARQGGSQRQNNWVTTALSLAARLEDVKSGADPQTPAAIRMTSLLNGTKPAWQLQVLPRTHLIEQLRLTGSQILFRVAYCLPLELHITA